MNRICSQDHSDNFRVLSLIQPVAFSPNRRIRVKQLNTRNNLNSWNVEGFDKLPKC